jgi:K+-sensing histidine kinase KdpD
MSVPLSASPRVARRPSLRPLAGALLAAIGLAGLTLILVPLRTALSLASVVLLYLVVVVATAVVGGLTPSLAAAVASDLVVNFFFVPPYHTLTVESRDHVITLVVYVAVAITVSLAMDLAARQRAAAARTGVEADLLARISAQPVREGSLQELLTHVRDTLHVDSAALIETGEGGTAQVVVAVTGHPLTGNPSLSVPAGDGLTLVVEGPEIFAPDPRFLASLAAAAARTLQAERLAAQAAHARELAEIDRLRAALLAAVGHDLRTPLAGIKAGVSSLRDPDLDLGGAEQAELLATIEESADRMADLVENLLAMTRLQAGALSVHARPVALDEVVSAALLHQPHDITAEIDVPDDLALAYADPGLLERVIANLLANAHLAGPAGSPVHITGRAGPDELELRVIDHGPGIPAADRDRMFVAFQRLDDHTTTGGLGLGLAIARGSTEAMTGTITATDTPGGGLTMTITLPAAP